MGNSQPQEPVLVLVVEDEPIVRALAADMLEDAEFEVVEAPTADLRSDGGRHEIGRGVVFTDVHMPGRMNGHDLARLIEDSHHRIGVVVTPARPASFRQARASYSSRTGPRHWCERS